MKFTAPLRNLRQTARKLRFNTWLLDGRERNSGQNISALFLGGGAGKTYLADRIFGDDYRETPAGREWLWNLPRVLQQRPVDIVVVTGIGPGLYRYLSGGRDFFIPYWVKGEIVFNELRARLKTSEHLKSDVRRIRKNNFVYEVTRSPERFDDFYHTMYVPHIRNAYGRTALLMRYGQMKELEGQCELMLVTQQGVPLAGQILIYEHGRVRCWSIGVKDGNREYVRMGAQAALYWYAMQHLSGQGYEAIHAGSSRAFLRDGVLRFKNKWGMRMLEPTRKGFLLKPLRRTQGVMSFLVNNPFIHIEHGQYVGIGFADAACTQDHYRDIFESCQSYGLTQLRIYTEQPHNNGIGLPDGMDDRFGIASIDTLFTS